ncbi:hypothetical protein BXY53_2349 [Dichotomicrobium thermohalophilum]|uniref:Uncharacterized protein n=1 Tax=Dichotomicrobium thermohalophilum TaxID=933063 RepID=A0A397PPU2_9HYPH|nr:hypothetical protein BXY53_2349 [Dichotomicrobium thermohalophilum]
MKQRAKFTNKVATAKFALALTATAAGAQSDKAKTNEALSAARPNFATTWGPREGLAVPRGLMLSN